MSAPGPTRPMRLAPSPPDAPASSAQARTLERERIANRPKHWVRLVTACNSKCLFCLDADTPRNVYLPEDEVQAELRRGIEQLGADKVILSGGEASLHPAFPALIRYAKVIGYD
jgi:molybdenum cofactor biosynthesis enzyme MoaA